MKRNLKRLTGRDKGGSSYYKKCFEEPCLGEMHGDCTECEYENDICERLAQYEDTGLTPKEVEELNDFSKSQCYDLLKKIAYISEENERLKEENKRLLEGKK